MKKVKENKNRIYFEGDLDENVLVFFLKKISDGNYFSNKFKSNLKIILIELITNAITHYHNLAFGKVLVEKNGDHYLISVTNFISQKNLQLLKKNLIYFKSLKEVKSQYHALLKSATLEKSAGLGLLEIYNRAKGNVQLQTQTVSGNKIITIKIKIYE